MGKKKTEAEEQETKKEEDKPKPKEDDEDDEEDEPIVKTLKEIDDKYGALQKELEAKIDALTKEYREKQAPFLAERSQALADASDAKDKETGTPACPGFWLQALNNSELGEGIEEHDEAVLEYLKDITCTDLGEDSRAGCRLEFVFAPNPYFTNEKLWTEFHSDFDREKYKVYEDPELVEMKSSGVDWKPGKNVTVEMTQKKVKGGGAKKAKQKTKATEVPRASFFRWVFRDLKKGDAIPEDASALLGEEVDEDDDEEVVDGLLAQSDELSSILKEVVIPFAIRLYTGEISADDSDDDEGEESESEGGDEEVDTDDDDDDDVAVGVKVKGKGNIKVSTKQIKEAAAKAAPGKGAGKSQEECKQQ